jgi:uncharacterized membrane protein YhaH (DUF805 family)
MVLKDPTRSSLAQGAFHGVVSEGISPVRDFKGRAQRKEYWMFALFNLVIMIVLTLVGGGGEGGLGDVLSGLYSLAVMVPSVAVTVRRLHDIGRSGWWALLMIVPLIGALILIFFAIQDSQPEANEYGPNPKAVPA